GAHTLGSHGDRGNRAVKIATPTVALVMLLAGVVAACSGNPSPSPSSGASPVASQASDAAQSPRTSGAPASASTAALEACALMTPADVSGIVGGPEPVAKALPGGGWVASKCA